MAMLFSVLGWVFTLAAVFVAIGDPMPGPGYEAALQYKQYATLLALSLALFFVGLGFVRGVRRLREARASSALAILLSVLWVGLMGASFLLREQ